MKKKIIGLCAIMLLASGCGKVPKLENGEDAIVKFDDGMISVNDFYENLKDQFGLDYLVTMIDTYIFESEFPDYKDEAKESAEAYIDAYIEQFGSRDELLNRLTQETKYQSIEAYQTALYVNTLRNHAVEEYAKLQITDKDIENYYNTRAIGSMDLSHILITSDAATDASKEDKEKAEAKAKKQANEIIEKLNEAKKNGEKIEDKFKELAKEYSKDSSNKDNGGSLGKIGYDDLSESYDELIKAATKLKDGEYSTSVITTELGYHIVLKTKSYEKETLEKMEDKIIKVLSEKYITKNSSTISLTAVQHYRKEYGMDIQDDEMNKQYAKSIQSLMSQSTSK